MTKLNETTKTCAVQTFIDVGNVHVIFDKVDCEVRDYINQMQREYWFIQNVQHTVLLYAGNDYGTYMVHVVMSRMWNNTGA